MNSSKRILAGTAFFAFSIFLAGCGYGGSRPEAATAEQVAPVEDYRATGFVLARDATVVDQATGARHVLLAGTELAILERKQDRERGLLFRIGIDRAEEEPGPVDLWVSEADLGERDLIPYAPADEIDEAEEMPEQGAEEAGLLKRAMTYCYRYVKQYLLQTGKVSVYLPGSRAFQAASILPKYGFWRTGHGPAAAANGEVCVYAGGPQGHGHIEVKRGGRWWYGYGYKSRSIQNRRFLGCFAK